MELWFLFFEARCRHIGLYIPDELRRSISAPSAEGRWPGEDPALNKGPTPLPTALPGLLPQGGSSSLGFPPYNRFEFKKTNSHFPPTSPPKRAARMGKQLLEHGCGCSCAGAAKKVLHRAG